MGFACVLETTRYTTDNKEVRVLSILVICLLTNVYEPQSTATTWGDWLNSFIRPQLIDWKEFYLNNRFIIFEPCSVVQPHVSDFIVTIC